MSVYEHTITIPAAQPKSDILQHIEKEVQKSLKKGEAPVRMAVTGFSDTQYNCEIGVASDERFYGDESIFSFSPRLNENTSEFNVALLVPTGIGSIMGGHAGDAGTLAKLFASACDNLITHPNVVNASDINEMTENTLYVEGSLISRCLMGTVGLHKIRSNRVIVFIDDHPYEMFTHAAINSVNAACASFGFDCFKIVKLNPSILLKSHYTKTGAAAGKIDNLDVMFNILKEHEGEYDAVAISSVIDFPIEYVREYFDSDGNMVNPWGGVEAMLTHSISEHFSVPSAHSPMMENKEICEMDPGIVDSRMAAEAVSLTFLNSILKGLQRSPRVIKDKSLFQRNDIISASDVSCVVMPDGCIGLPTLAALKQGIPVIAVRENKNLMQKNNDLTKLPWKHGQLHIVDSYLEAIGVLNAMKAGVSIRSLKRPLDWVKVEAQP